MALQREGKAKAKVQKGTCVRCSIPTDDTCYEVAHEDILLEYCAVCFTCSSCKQQIDPDGKVIIDGRADDVICDACYASKAPTCGVCHKVIHGTAAVVRHETYHTDCFKCANRQCGRQLEDDHYGMTPQEWRCVACFALECSKCDNCGESILDTKVTVDGKSFHPSCFVCTRCNQQCESPAQRHPDKDGEFLCQRCHVQMAPPCCVCRGACDDRYVILHDMAFHPECLTCSVCDDQIDGPVFGGSTPQEHLCASCNLATAPLCAKCSKPILDPHTIANDEPYHSECFACSTCGRPGSLDLVVIGDQFLCTRCRSAAGPAEKGGPAAAQGGGKVAAGSVRQTQGDSGPSARVAKAGVVKKGKGGDHQVDFQLRKARGRSESALQDVHKRT